VIALHDEADAFAEKSAALQTAQHARRAWDAIAIVTAFKAVVLEGLEVVFIVLAVGAAGGLLLPASIGALAACALVVILGCAVHRPLAKIPENTLKFTVGVLLSAFGVFWVGEGLGFHWPGMISRSSALRRSFSPPRPPQWAGSRKGATPPRLSRAGRSSSEMARRRRPGDRRPVHRGCGVCARHPRLGRARRVRRPRAALADPWRAAILLAGCLALLVENVLRAARKRVG